MAVAVSFLRARRTIVNGWWRVRRVRWRLRLASYWWSRGDLDEALRHAYLAVRLNGAQPPSSLLAAEALMIVADLEHDRDNHQGSGAHATYALKVLDAELDSVVCDRLRIRALTVLGDSQRRAGRYSLAVETLQKARTMAETIDAPAPLRAVVLTVLGIVAKEIGAFAAAAGWYAQVAALLANAGMDLCAEAALHHNLAGLAYARGRYAEAESNARHAIALRRQGMADGQPTRNGRPVHVAADLAVLGSALAAQNRLAEARAVLYDALAICGSARPRRWYDIAVQLHNLASIEQADGRPVDAESLYRLALSIKRRLLGANHPETGLLYNNLATVLDELGRVDEAAACRRDAFALTVRVYPYEHPTNVCIRANVGVTGCTHSTNKG